MLHFSRKNVISYEEGSSSDEDASSFLKMEKRSVQGSDKRHANDRISDALGTLFMNREVSTVNKKLLFGTLTKHPEKFLDCDEGDNSRTLAAIAFGGLTANNSTPMFNDGTEDSQDEDESIARKDYRRRDSRL